MAWKFYDSDGKLQVATSAGGAGEANTASNVGAAGVGLFKQKTGVDLEFKNVNAGSSKITVTDDVANDEVDIDVAPGQIDHNDLGNIDGGTAGQYYHLTSAQHTELTDWLAAVTLAATGDVSGIGDITGKAGGITLTGGTGASDNLALSSTSNATKGIISSDSDITIDNNADSAATFTIDSGSTTAQNSRIDFADQGTAYYSIAKNSSNNLNFFNGSAVSYLLFLTTGVYVNFGQDSAVDFQVRSQGQTNQIFVDSSANTTTIYDLILSNALALDYGGTEANLSATGPGALVQASSGAAVTVETLALERGGTESDLSSAGPGVLQQRTAGAAVTNLLHNFAAGAAPTTGDDTNDGYEVGSYWYDTTNDKAYVCLDATAAAAVWTETTGAGGGASQLTDLSDVSAAAQTANFVLAAGDGSSGGDYRGRALVNADIPTTLDGKILDNVEQFIADAATELTISTGAITVVQMYHSVDTESDAASDDLDTINGGVEGEIIVLQAENTARTVVIKHSTGNIETPSGYDYHLDNTELMAVLQYNGTSWILQNDPNLAIYPQRATLWIDEWSTVSGDDISAATAASSVYNITADQDSPADGDEYKSSFMLKEGTYTFHAIGITANNRPIVDWAIDGVDFATGQDWYSGATTYNVLKSVSSVAVTSSGRHTITLTVNGKNASSSNYFLGSSVKVWFEPASDTTEVRAV